MKDETPTQAVQLVLEKQEDGPPMLMIAIEGFPEGTEADDPEVTLFLTQMLAIQIVATQGGFIVPEAVAPLLEPLVEVLYAHVETRATQLGPTINA